jgi:predicted lipoprotein with Yx(FWY)xxD motif
MSRAQERGGRFSGRSVWALAALLAAVAVAALAAMAGAKTKAPPTLSTAHNARLGATIVVDSRGRTLYTLSPETTHHLLCTSSLCFHFWPPVKVSKTAKLTKASRVHGSLGKLRRHGFLQLTLNGHPLYRFSADMAKGQANGEGIRTFGGTWHVVKTAGTAGGATHTTTTSSSSTSSSYSPGY